MMIQPLVTLPRSQSSGSGASDPSISAGNVNETAFLQLLVAQIQYQDPTNPTDSTAFVTQLAQFSSLEQLIGIRGDLDSLSTQDPGTSSNSQTGGN